MNNFIRVTDEIQNKDIVINKKFISTVAFSDNHTVITMSNSERIYVADCLESIVSLLDSALE